MEFSDEQIAAVKAKYPGKIHVVSIGDDQYYFRKPSIPEFESFIKTSHDEETRHTALRTLVLDTIVLPDRKAFLAELEEFPGLYLGISGKVLDLCTKGKASDAKKA